MALIGIKNLTYKDRSSSNRFLALELDDARTVTIETEVGFDTLLFWWEEEVFALENNGEYYRVSEETALDILTQWGYQSDSESWTDSEPDTWIVALLEEYEEA